MILLGTIDQVLLRPFVDRRRSGPALTPVDVAAA